MNENRFKDSGSIIAVSYEARAVGVKRIMSGAEARKVCPEMILVQVPTSHGKADLTIYRDASANILKVLGQRYASVTIERASVDEVYLDITNEAARLLQSHDPAAFLGEYIECVRSAPTLIAGADSKEIKMTKADIRNGYAGQGVEAGLNESVPEEISSVGKTEEDFVDDVSWFDRPAHQWSMEDRMLLAGTVIVQQLRKDVWDNLEFTCSAGIATNKMLAKLASGMHKPNKQTLVPTCVVRNIINNLPFSRVQGFGGKLGHEITRIFGEEVQTMSHLLALSKNALLTHFGPETTQWIWQRANGIDYDLVKDRSLPISIGCSKSFRSSNILTPQNVQDGSVLFWLNELAAELYERILTDTEINQRKPRQLHVGFSVYIHTPASSANNGSRSSTGNNITQLKQPTGVAQWWEQAGISLSKTTKLPMSASADIMAKIALSLMIRAINENQRVQQELSVNSGTKTWGITSIGLSVTNFDKIESGKKSISSYLVPKTEGTDPISSATTQDLDNSTFIQAAGNSIKTTKLYKRSAANSGVLAWMQSHSSDSIRPSAHENKPERHQKDIDDIISIDILENSDTVSPDMNNIQDEMTDIQESYTSHSENNPTHISHPIDDVLSLKGENDDNSVIDLLEDDIKDDRSNVIFAQQQALHSKFLRHIEWTTFIALPMELQQELINEARFHQTPTSTETVGQKRLASQVHEQSTNNKR